MAMHITCVVVSKSDGLFKVCELVEQKDTLCIPALRRRRVTSVM
jgi:hypothetical protein